MKQASTASSMRRFGGAASCRAGPTGGGGDDEEDEAAADAAMLSEEEALIVTSRLHQVWWGESLQHVWCGSVEMHPPAVACHFIGAQQAQHQIADLFSQVLRPFMLRRLKQTVASELPQKVGRWFHVCRLPGPPHPSGMFTILNEAACTWSACKSWGQRRSSCYFPSLLQVERLVPCQPSAYQRALFSILETQLQAAEGGPWAGNFALAVLFNGTCSAPIPSPLWRSACGSQCELGRAAHCALPRDLQPFVPGHAGKAEGRVGIKGVKNTIMEMRNFCNHPLIR